MPHVSVVIPTHNRKLYVAQAVESVLAQTYRDFEVIVVDDGSTDGTADLLKAKFGDSVRVERFAQNLGRSVARNTGWVMARGEFVGFLDSDDIWLPEKLARQLPLLESGAAIVHCGVGKIDKCGRPLEEETREMAGAFDLAASRGFHYGGITQTWCFMYTSAVVLRHDLLSGTGGFDPALCNSEDWDLFWTVARQGKVGTVRDTLVLHRRHAGNTPVEWNLVAEQWLTVMRKHIAACPPNEKRARVNLLVNMALGEFWRRDLVASRRWMWRALWADPSLLLRSGFAVWGAPALHACLPHFLASRAVKWTGVDQYLTEETPVV